MERVLEDGQQIDRYVVESLLGSGGMAEVYRVRHADLGSAHALKVLTVRGHGVEERLEAEGRIQATLSHPNVLAVTDRVTVDGAPGLVMELVDGPSLEDWLEEEEHPLATRQEVFRGIIAGVEAAHDAGLVHRDLKPANVLMAPDGDSWIPKIADFGLVKAALGDQSALSATRSGMPMGTPAFMAPEQIADAKRVDQRADLWSLGCILYEIATDRQAFGGGGSIVEVFNGVLSGSYDDPTTLEPDLPTGWVRAIRACLKTNPDERPSDCAALVSLLDDNSVLQPPAAVDAAAGALPRWAPAAVLGGVGLLAAIGAVLLFGAGLFGASTLMAGPCGGVPGTVVGYGLYRGPRPPPKTWVVGRTVPVHRKTDAETSVVCTLPRGTKIEVRDEASKAQLLHYWVPIRAGAITLPEETE